MKNAKLHHVSLVTSDIGRAVSFYCDKLGFRQIQRPAFKSSGAWLESDAVELHLILNAAGTFRKTNWIDDGDVHFAIRVADFEAQVSELKARGFEEGPGEAGKLHMKINRKSPTGYLQLYLLDADRHVIEINAAA